jgi:hypothetical protein
MTYPAGYLKWLESLESRFNITAGDIWEAAQAAERERHGILLEALLIIAGRKQCLDNLMSDQDIALDALTKYDGEK